MQNLSKPIFLVLEGLDGSGKSSVAEVLAQRLDAVYLSTPLRDLSEVRSKVDAVFSQNPLASTCWYAAHVSEASQRAATSLAMGRSVVMDRYGLSTMAYSRMDDPVTLFQDIAKQWTIPFATIFLHPPHELRLARLKARGSWQPHDELYLTQSAEERLIARYLRFSKQPVAGRFYDFRIEENWTVPGTVDRILDLFYF